MLKKNIDNLLFNCADLNDQRLDIRGQYILLPSSSLLDKVLIKKIIDISIIHQLGNIFWAFLAYFRFYLKCCTCGTSVTWNCSATELI